MTGCKTTNDNTVSSNEYQKSCKNSHSMAGPLAFNKQFTEMMRDLYQFGYDDI